ncbi:MAG: adenylate/guanylate cyclase domain-containing protein [candidate division KSB1 bacterium]|nr:adenylate/guanylate cyclase domain-containing protein [candidate division KSB1 bacterium]MDZ7303659.1 adenylate/guanylate cyclase domain-containing protein [candidate division KSB1 bacterium]MDZ7313321.1 adenylate/guanylate cyclase domain-containing protein [candidate division KSB1 bacterium]
MDQKTNTQPRPTPKHKLSAIMFTDMTGFSRKMGDSERLTLKLLRDHNRIIRFLVRKHHGRIIKSTGDGFLLDFDSAVEAVQCAIEAQERFQRYNLNKPECEQIVVRVGINLGEVRIVDADLFGDEVNIAARIQTLAEPGGICISRDVYDHVKNKLSIVAVNLGPQELKNIRHKVEIYKILVRAVGQEAIEIPSTGMSSMPAFAKSNGNISRRSDGRQQHFWSRFTLFKKNQPTPVAGFPMATMAATGEAGRHVRQNRYNGLLLKAVPTIFFTLVLSTVWITSHSGANGFVSSLADMTQWFAKSGYANTSALSQALSKKTIAVLYFENRTKDPRDHWMCIGLADMLMTDLERTTPLHVLGRPRLMDVLKDLGKENVQTMDLALARNVAEKAQVDVMLLGTIMRDGKTLRIDTQLYDVRHGEMLLAEKAQGESVFNMVDELTRQLKKQMVPAVQAMM